MSRRASTRTVRRLRREQTAPEELLWSHLRNRRLGGFKFRRQAPLDRFIADFLCVEAKLIIEVDGPTHDGRVVADAERTRIFDAMGYLLVRFDNEDVMTNIEGVLDEIFHTLHLHGGEIAQGREPPHPGPLPAGERE